jgi:predicted Zn-dependent protease
VQQNPQNFFWRKQLAKVASWNNRPRVALQQWVYLAKNQKDAESINESIKIAKMLNKDELLAELFKLRIEYGFGYQEAWSGYVTAKEALGKPEEAITELKASIQEKPELFKYERLAALYSRAGDSAAELEVLHEIRNRYGLIPRFALRQAELLYSSGNVKEAHNILAKASAAANDKDYNFWNSLAQLSWMMRDYANAKVALAKLYQMKRIDSASLLNYITLLSNSNKRMALELATYGWEKYKANDFVVQILILAMELKEWDQVGQVINDLPKKTELFLNEYPYFYVVKAQYFAHVGSRNEALQVFDQAMKKFSELTDIKISYLWFLIDNKFKDKLRYELYVGQKQAMENVIFAPVYAAGYIYLGKPESALIVYQKFHDKKEQDYDWLLNYADALTQLNRTTDAIRMRHLAYFSLLDRTNLQAKKEASASDMIKFARVAMYQNSGDITAKTVPQLLQYADNHEAQINVLIWALRNNNAELSNHFLQRYADKAKMPAWIKHSVALQNNDREAMHKLLQDELSTLPYRDRVTSAARIGNERLAQNLAYRGLYEHPTDSEMYKLFTETHLRQADDITIGPAFRQVGAIRGWKFRGSGTKFLTPRVSVMPWVDIWRTKTKNPTIILPATKYDKRAGLRVNWRYPRGLAGLNVGYRNALDGFVTAVFNIIYRVDSRLNLIGTLGYNQEADESTALLIAGMKHNARIDFGYTLTPRDYFSGGVAYQNFRSQDNVHLGNGQLYRISYAHKFQLAYPDWNTRVFIRGTSYQHNGRVSNKAARIVPAGQAPTVDFFVPGGSIYYGAGFGFGQGYRYEYTHAWRPFAEVNAFYKTFSGMGYYGQFGIAGSVFGRDHLAFYINPGIGVETSGQKDYVVGVDYKMYF